MSAQRFAAAMLGIAATIAAAHASEGVSLPLFDDRERLPDGTTLFPDATSSNVYYYVPDDIRLDERDGRPAFGLYKAVHADASATASKGLLSMAFHREPPEAEERRRWLEALHSRAELRPLPAEGMKLRLLLPAPGAGGARELVVTQLPFRERAVALRLDAATTTLLWEALADPRGPQLLADVELRTPGFTRDGEGGYERGERTDRFSVSIPVSRSEHPALFEVLDQSQRVSFEYRDLTVYCFELADGGSTDLALVRVEIAVRNERGQRRIKAVRFGDGSDPIQRVSFDVPEERDSSYRYRVSRYSRSDAPERRPWREARTASLDVCASEPAVAVE